MQLNRVNHNASDNTAGVSEIIGAVLLISIVVAAVALIGIFLFSQQTPEKIPNINFMTGTDNSGNLYLYHNGGDSLKKGEFAVKIDGNLTPYELSDGTWSLGESLTFKNVPPGVHSVAIIYNGTSGAESAVLRSGSSSSSVFSGTINPDSLPGSAGPSGDSPGEGYIFNDAANISNSTYFVTAIQQNITNNYVSFFRDTTSGRISSGSHFFFDVTDTTQHSSITYRKSVGENPKTIKLSSGDRVYITPNHESDDFRTFGIAPQIWEIYARDVNLTIKWGVNGTNWYAHKNDNVDIVNAYIGKYGSIDSTLTLDTKQKDSMTTLKVNSTEVLNEPFDERIVITNFRPLPIGLFVFQQNSDGAYQGSYLVGNAESICVDGNCIPPLYGQ
ncbi:MAG: type IV pilin N-terminal domain-containing protein [Methanoregula sp.]|nr:type IV pilin N-terminal domain-containing protein [Methanoregula sp.]